MTTTIGVTIHVQIPCDHPIEGYDEVMRTWARSQDGWITIRVPRVSRTIGGTYLDEPIWEEYHGTAFPRERPTYEERREYEETHPRSAPHD